MIELDETLLAETIGTLDDIETNLDNAVDRSHRDSVYRDIEQTVDYEILNPILKRARELGAQHVGDRVQYIEPVTGQWQGNDYVAGLRSNNEVVLAHEYGTGQYTATGPYRITPTTKEALAFTVNGVSVVVDFVVHPGVRGRRFMQRAIREKTDEVLQEAREETQQTLVDAFDT